MTFNYKDKETVFENASLDIDSGIWLLDGVNGAGKTTFLKLLIDLKLGELSEETTISVNGTAIFLDKDTTLPLNLEESDIAEYIFYINDVVKKEKYIPIYNNKKLSQYSTGELKLATFRILSELKIDLLLIDEYIANIDDDNLEEVMNILEKISSNGALIIVSSNEADIKRRFSKVISILDKKLEVR
jgi:lipopolysaccharide transport system ATP-binding protein